MIAATLFYVLLMCVFFYVVKWCFTILRQLSIMRHFPYPGKEIFLLGNDIVLQSEVEMFASLRKFAKSSYPHYATRIFYISSVHLLTPEDCEIFMSTRKHSSKSIVYNGLKVWLNEGLLLSDGNKWFQRRKILTHAFHFNILKNFVNVFNEETLRTVNTLYNECNEPIEVSELVTEFTLLSICETAMGYKMDPQEEYFKKYVAAVAEFGHIFLYKMMRPWLTRTFLYPFTETYRREKECLRILHDFSRKIIKKRMESFDRPVDSNGTDEYSGEAFMVKRRRHAMLDVLLQAQKEDASIDFEGICEEVDTFIFEGHDTTATAISFCLLLIANHPEVQERIVKEMKDIMEDELSKPTYEDLQKMDYLERCIKETLRLYPSVAFISRSADEDTVLHSGLVVPKGVVVNIPIYDVLRNPRIFPSPDKFYPDRFLPENCQERHPFAYIPFSAGTRNCIGQKYAMLEIKAFLTGVLSRFVLTPIDTPETLILTHVLILKSKFGIKVKLTPRQ